MDPCDEASQCPLAPTAPDTPLGVLITLSVVKHAHKGTYSYTEMQEVYSILS